MPIVETHNLKPTDGPIRQIYNALDCMITLEVNEELNTLFNQVPEVYKFERALQAPLLDMMLRGFKVDEYERQKAIKEVSLELDELHRQLQILAQAVWGAPLNPQSPQQLKAFFYQSMSIPEVVISDKGKKRVSTNREALEKIEIYFHARPIVAAILAFRDKKKQLSVLISEVDPDGRMRTSYNMSTETGRLSSSKSVTASGTNIQNLQKDDDAVSSGHKLSIRRLFISDPEWKLCGIDLEQTESHDVGWLHGTLLDDWTYLEAVQAGDIHTAVCKMVWPEKTWTGDKKIDRALAEHNFYRNFSYRDMAKRGGHASNYRVTPWTMSRHLKIPLKTAEKFQEAYFTAFPCFPKWFQWVSQEIETKQYLVTPFGRKRHFFGRSDDDSTLREAIAYVPQSTTADRMNLGMWRFWRWSLETGRTQLLAQVHDAIYFQYRAEDELTIIPAALKIIETPFVHGTHSMVVRGEAKVGWNWGNANTEFNPYGLKKFDPKAADKRIRPSNLNRIV